MENNVRILSLDLGENGLEVGFLVGGALAGDWIYFARFEGFFNFVGQPFAVGRFIVDERNFLAF